MSLNMMKFNIIACTDSNLVIGKNGDLLYKISDDLKYFKKMTLGHILIMGHNTFKSLPKPVRPLPNRLNLVISHNTDVYNEDITCNGEECYGYIINSQKYILNYLEKIYDNITYYNKKIFIIGGGRVYNDFMNYVSNHYYIDKIYLTQVLSKAKSSAKELANNENNFVYFPKIPADTFTLTQNSEIMFDTTENVKYVFLIYTNHTKNENIKRNVNELQYLNTLRYILNEGCLRANRTGIDTISVFGGQTQFDISESIPIITTKFVPTKGCIEELLWFLRGDTDAKNLQKIGVKIWDGNSSREFLDKVGLSHYEEGDVGPMYSHQWRHAGAEYYGCSNPIPENEYQGIDQIEETLRLLKEDPFNRRILINAWNVNDLDKMCITPCHNMVQFYVELDKYGNKHLSCHMYQRSCDMFLGEPWNIMSYAILTYIFAKKTGMKPYKLFISFGDCHIYENHIEQCREQLKRNPLAEPKIILDDSIITKNWSEITVNDFQVIGYFSHPVIKADMAV